MVSQRKILNLVRFFALFEKIAKAKVACILTWLVKKIVKNLRHSKAKSDFNTFWYLEAEI